MHNVDPKARSLKPNPRAVGGQSPEKIVGRNKKASFKYQLVSRVECGIVLSGSEVKSLRAGRVGFEDAHAVIENGVVILKSLHIPLYDKARGGGHETTADRRLLLNKNEILKLQRKVVEKGMTLIPTAVYFKGGWAKVELALAEGKRQYDKRQALKERENKREMDRVKKIRRGE